MENMKWCYSLILAFLCSSVLGIQNLTFYGDYVVFRPDTTFIQFKLVDELDVILLEHRSKPINTKESPYRIHLVSNRAESVNYTFYRKGKLMATGNYPFWNRIEADNIAMRWHKPNEKRNRIEVLTYTEGNPNSVISWLDRSKNQPTIKYTALRVKLNTTKNGLLWKMQETEDDEVDLHGATTLLRIKFLSEQSEVKPIYEIIQIQEEDKNFWIYIKKGKEEVLRVKTLQLEGILSISWDINNSLLAIGHEKSLAPVLLWQDPNPEENNFSKIKNLSIWTRDTNYEDLLQIKENTFIPIPRMFLEFLTHLLVSKETAKPNNETNLPETTSTPQMTFTANKAVEDWNNYLRALEEKN